MSQLLELSPLLAGPLMVALLVTTARRKRRRPPQTPAESFDGAIGDGWRR